MGKSYRWLKVRHPDLDLWGIKSPLPWPRESREINPKADFPFETLLKGISLLRAEPDEWQPEWGAIETFVNRGDELNDAIERSDFAKVLRLLDELETLRPGTAYCAFNRAFALRATGDFAGAVQAATTATERAPKLEYLWMRRGNLHEHQEDEKSAIFSYRKALALFPGHQQALEGLARLGAMCKMTFHHPDGTHTQQYFTKEEFARMVKENAAKMAPDDPQLRSLLKQFRESRDAANALIVIDRILSGDPPDARLLRVYRADALRELGRVGEASELISRIIAEEPRLAEAHYVQAWCEFSSGNNADGYAIIARVLSIDPNHQQAIQVHLRLTPKSDASIIDTVCEWGELHQSWRAYWLASVHASDLDDKPRALRCAEAAYRLAPHERDALFLYANCLNNMQEGEYTAALLHPRLPEAKGDFLLRYVFAGAMNKLGLREEAVRVLREVLEDDEIEMTLEWKGWTHHFLDELTGMLAQSEIDPEFHPSTDTFRRGIWVGDDQGPKTQLIPAGVAAPAQRPINMEPAPGYTGSTGSVALYTHGHNAELDPVSLGWFRAHEIDFAEAEKPQMLISVTERKKLEATARQGTRRLPVTWTLYRVPSMETEGK